MNSRHRALLAGAIAIGALARFATLDLQSFHHDEAVTAGRVLQPSLFDTMGEVADGERSPPLYYLLAWLWSQPFGLGEVGLRSLSALAGTLMIPAAFVAGRELASPRVGLCAAAFVALSPILVWYSQEARSYIVAALMVTLALVWFARAMRSSQPRPLWLWALFSVLALCSHYFAVFLIAPQALWLALAGPAARRARAASAAVVLAGLALVPLALVQQGEDRREGYTDLSLPGRVTEVGIDYAAGEEPDPLAAGAKVDAVQLGAGAGGLLLLAGAVALLRGRGSREERRAALWMATVAGAAIGVPVLVAAVGLDFLKPRNLVAGVVPILLLGALGYGLQRAGRTGLAGAAATCALFAGVLVAVNASEDMQREDWRRAADEIGPATAPRLVVVPQNGDDPLALYLDAERFVGSEGRDGVRTNQVVVLTTAAGIDPPSGFEVAGRTTVPPLFELWWLRSDRERLVTAADVGGILAERSAVLLDPG